MTIQDLICKACGQICNSRYDLALHIAKSSDNEHEPHKKDAALYIEEIQSKLKEE